ncbi:hypothetical protein M427DRAFT_53819 [Gonapodya prolifera JEL478]|uniref:Uncharacterized protein n=1 Tax=Gonapodya prolifera (strain JEL478) TaxID=1344416 RepID=A0A139AP61_GONPJ|nr:hypothetical protein M427DRAFT_53819 [Gonapodya prolifera JEL478]|eukprot:KXS18434.1 hypothetical protein M427DRAFT_53819 [Gonapodya prolifera JEL478]
MSRIPFSITWSIVIDLSFLCLLVSSYISPENNGNVSVANPPLSCDLGGARW